MSKSTRTPIATGVVLDAHARPLSNIVVRAYWPRLREQILLGETTSGECGRFQIDLKLGDDMPCDVRIELVASHDHEKIDVSQRAQQMVAPRRAVRPRAPRGTKHEARSGLLELDALTDVELRFGEDDKDEHSRLVARIEPLLGKLQLGELEDSEEHGDIGFVAAELDIPPEHVMRLVMAARVGDRLGLPAAVAYAFLRLDVPSSLPAPLLEASERFRMIEPLTAHVTSLIVGVDAVASRAALERAWKRRLIPAELEASAEKIYARLASLREAQRLDTPLGTGKTPLRSLLHTAGLEDERHGRFVAAFQAHRGSAARFWENLAKEGSGFEAKEVAMLERTFDVGALVKNHLPMVVAVRRRLDGEQAATVADLARLELKDWVEIVEKAGKEAVPPNILPSGDEAPALLYAREIFERVQRRYPTTALATKVERDGLAPEKLRRPLATFFRGSPTLDLVRVNLGAWLETHGAEAFANVEPSLRDATIREVERLQRVVRISRNPEVGAVLLAADLDASAKIHALGRGQTMAVLTDRGLAAVEAARVHAVATMRYAASTALFLQLNASVGGIYPAATGPAAPFGEPVASAIKRNPSLANLFGSQDGCAVDPCTSILSPSAYLTDLLLWLRNRRLSSSPHETALAAFGARRPDILHLDLDCANTNTPLPYIDLVNELLEDAVSPPATPVWRQTTRTAAQLRAAPEHVNDAAYVVLAGAAFPHHLPYDRPLDELGTVLGRSDVALWQLREATLPVAAGATDPHRIAIAAARFGIGAGELALVTTPASAAGARPLSEVWGTASPVTDLEVVHDFLQAAQLSYDEMLQLLACRWPRAGGAAITLSGVDDTCDTSVQRLVGLDASKLDRIHRFLRAWRRTGWAMWELDELLRSPAVGNDVLDGAALVALFAVRRLQDLVGLPVEQLLAIWQDIGTSGHRIPGNVVQPSLYTRIFENPLLPADPALVLATLLAGPAPALAAHLPAVRAALTLTADEAATLSAASDGQLTLATLSGFFRAIAVSRALRLDLDEAAYVAGGTLAAAFASPTATLAFVTRARELSRAGLDPTALRHVLTQTATAAGRTEGALAEAIVAVRTALQQVEDDVQGTDEPTLAILQRQLASLPTLRGGDALATAISIVDGTYTGNTADRNAFIATHFAAFMDVTAAQAALAFPLATPPVPAGPREAEVATRASTLLAPLVRWLTNSRVIASVASTFSITEAHAALLLREIDLPGGTDPLLDTLTDPALVDRVPATGAYVLAVTPAAMPAAFTAMRLLDKLALVIRGLRLQPGELAWLVERGAAVGGTLLSSLPVLPAQAEQSIDAWLTTTRFVMLDRAFDRLANSTAVPAPSFPTLRAVIDGIVAGTLATDAAIHGALAGITGWREADVAAAAVALGVSLAASTWTRVESHERIRRLVAMTTATGASAEALVRWGAPTAPTQAHADESWQALVSRYGADAWLEVAPSIMDPLRERRRDALCWRLLATRDGSGVPVWGVDTADLFARFLLDTQMSSCQTTSRVVQAYAAVQLFVQRVLMNLERDVQADPVADDDWLQWKWMDRYRVWEAARKVFLWPENWMLESQRPTRSEIFVAFDRDVQQREATSDSLELAALGYMDRLAEVAQLRVTGMCSQPRTGTLYVVGRTPSDPTQYYLRRFEHRQWTPWQKVPLDVASGTVVPAFFAGRLHLFWLQVFVTPEPQQRLPATEGAARDSEAADKHVEIRIYMSSLRDAEWSPPQVAAQSFFDKPFFASSESVRDDEVALRYGIKVQPSGVSLLLDVYRTGPTSALELFVAGMLDGFGGTHLDTARDGARHIGRAVFDGRFAEMQLRNIAIEAATGPDTLLDRAREIYGSRAQDLLALPEPEAEPALPIEPEMRNEAGGLVARQPHPDASSTEELRFDATIDTGRLLRTVPLPYRVIGLANDAPFTPESPFVLNEPKRTWFVEPTRYWRHGSVWQPVPPSVAGSLPTQLRFRFTRFDHPFVRTMRHVLSTGGFDAFFRSALQRDPGSVLPDPAPFHFRNAYDPTTTIVTWGSDTDTLDFGYDAPYAGYNWEAFYHLPLFVANRLAQNQRFEEARQWFHYIFDPTRVSTEAVPQRYWLTRPLAELTSTAVQAQRIENLLAAVNRREPAALGQVARWRDDPFDPYLLGDLRPVAHMKRVVMSYLDNLVGWGDALFATASRESLNEATLLYVLASELLGPRPQFVPPPPRASASWTELEPQLDAFANAMVAIENLVPPSTGGGGGGEGPPLPAGQTFFFKIPPNDKLLAYWDTVEDRLFKLRHCQGLGGEALALPLFDAPIDPALLVRARAAGLDLGQVLLDLGAPLPSYRFTELHRRATSYADAVVSLGQSLLAAIESRDAEALANLLLSQRRRVHADSAQVLEWKVEEAKALEHAIDYAIELEDYRIEGAAHAPFMSELEITYVTMKSITVAQKIVGMITYLVSAGLAGVPQFLLGVAGVGGSPQAGASTGGPPISDAVAKGAKAAEKFNEFIEKGADLIKTFSEAEKRAKENKKKGKEAEYDKKRLEQELEAAKIRVKIAEYELEHLERAGDELDAEWDFLQSKASNEALYDWMVGQLSTVYFRAFRLAESMARRAERCYRFELGLVDSAVIGTGHWDSLHRGLLAGENLAHDLRRLESSYLELNVRRKETTRTVSLRRELPERLFTLLTTGSCDVPLDELLFDRDYPGHYQRRIVRASITVERPDAREDDNVVCVVTMLNNSVRLVPTIGDGYPRLPAPTTDLRFADQFAAVQGIVTGNAIDDPGVHLRDVAAGLSDPRYLPFENAGAISTWRIELPASRNAIDLSTVSDVKLHLHYSAIDGGAALATAAQAAVDAAVPATTSIAFDVAREFPEAWDAFLAGGGAPQQLVLPLRRGLLPPTVRSRDVVVTHCNVHVLTDDGARFEVASVAPFPTSVVAVEPPAPGAIVSSGTIAIGSASVQPLPLRLRLRGASDWASLPRDRVHGIIVELELGVS